MPEAVASAGSTTAAAPSPGAPRPVRLPPPLAIACIGGLLTGLAIASSLSGAAGAGSTLGQVAITELADASSSVDPATGSQPLQDARNCKVPMAYVTLAATGSDKPNRVRIHSGSYQSPTIVITSEPRRIAIPFPAAYETGRGVISVEGEAKDLSIWLAPVWSSPLVTGPQVINVVWTPKSPC